MSDRAKKEDRSESTQSQNGVSPDSVIRISNLGHSYEQDPVLHGVNLTVERGELLSILGASGSGKSTLLRAIAGFVTPRRGEIELDGRVVCSEGSEYVSPQERRLGMMFQDYALFPFMSVAENVAYGIHTRADRQQRVAQLLELVGLTGYETRSPSTLSGGQQQRVALVRALAPRPVALLLDEPFANLDGALRESVGHEVRRILREEQTTGVLVTHDRSEALGLADRVALFGPIGPDGQPGLIQVGTPDSVYRNPLTVDAARLTGPATFLDAQCEADIADTVVGKLELSQSFHGRATVMIRPHQWAFTADEDGGEVVAERQFTGPDYRHRITGSAGSIWLPPNGLGLKVGTRGRLMVSGPVIPFRP